MLRRQFIALVSVKERLRRCLSLRLKPKATLRPSSGRGAGTGGSGGGHGAPGVHRSGGSGSSGSSGGLFTSFWGSNKSSVTKGESLDSVDANKSSVTKGKSLDSADANKFAPPTAKNGIKNNNSKQNKRLASLRKRESCSSCPKFRQKNQRSLSGSSVAGSDERLNNSFESTGSIAVLCESLPSKIKLSSGRLLGRPLGDKLSSTISLDEAKTKAQDGFAPSTKQKVAIDKQAAIARILFIDFVLY